MSSHVDEAAVTNVPIRKATAYFSIAIDELYALA